MQQEKFITVPQLAKIMGLSRSQVFRKVQAGEIPAQKIGRIFVVSKDYVDALTGEISSKDEKVIKKGVNKTLKEYGEVIKQLGDA